MPDAKDSAVNPVVPKPVGHQTTLRWYQCRPSALIVAVSLAAIVFVVLLGKMRSITQSLETGPGDTCYRYRSEWVNAGGLWPRDDEWDPRSSKDRYGFDCPILADGYEVKMDGPAYTDEVMSHTNFHAYSPIRTINLEHSLVTDSGLKRLQGVRPLLALDLDCTPITDKGLECLEPLRQLRWLSLRETKVSDEGMGTLRKLPRLQWLDLVGTSVTDAGVRTLSEHSQLQVLCLHDTHVSDAGILSLKNCSQLRQLYVPRTQVTDDGVRQLSVALPHCRIVK